MSAGVEPVIMVTGADGQVGWELRRTLAPLGRVVAVSRADVDLADRTALRALVRAQAPVAIVNAAAFTAVDRAETDRDLAFAVNAAAPAALADEAARTGAVLVHYSSDYVFDGTKTVPYTEDDRAAPLCAYGESKLAGDEAVLASRAPHLVFRTSWLYAARGRNFLRTVLRLARECEELRVVADQTGVPTPARLVAETTAAVLARHATGGGYELPASRWGVYHLAARGQATRHEFASAIVAADPRPEGRRCRTVTAVTTPERPTAARRPAYSVLDPSKLERTFGLRMPGWREQLALVMAELGEQGGS